MASKQEIKQYAVNYLALYPNTTEAGLRAAMHHQFLGEATSDTKAAAIAKTSVEAGMAFGHPVGCLAGLFLALGVGIPRWLFGPNVGQVRADIDAVVSSLQAEGRWPKSANS